MVHHHDSDNYALRFRWSKSAWKHYLFSPRKSATIFKGLYQMPQISKHTHRVNGSMSHDPTAEHFTAEECLNNKKRKEKKNNKQKNERAI